MTVEFPESFKSADFFDCGEPEQLSHDCVEDALEYYFDSFGSLGCDMRAIITEHCPISVTAFHRKRVDTGSFQLGIAQRVETLVDNLNEDFAEEFCDPDDDSTGIDEDAIGRIRDLVLKEFAALSVWQCEPTESVEFSAEQVCELLKDWIDL